MIKEDKYLELVVRGINSLEIPNAKVKWNEKLNGRQFDVVARFDTGPYRILMLIEVRNKERRSTASDIEAFVTKASDQNANKMIFVTRSNYQSGAIEVAKKHGVDLFKINFVPGDAAKDSEKKTWILLKRKADGTGLSSAQKIGPHSGILRLSTGPTVHGNVIRKCSLFYENGNSIELPEEPTQLEYYLKNTQLGRTNNILHTIKENIHEVAPIGNKISRSIVFDPVVQVTPPDSFFIRSGKISSIQVVVEGENITTISGRGKVDPTTISPDVEYVNVITKKSMRYSMADLPIGEQEVVPGCFYFAYHPLRYVYCESVGGGKMTLVLVESFQNGRFFQCRITGTIEYSSQYIPVSDKAVLERLQLRLEEFNKFCAK